MEFDNETATQKHKKHWFLTVDKKSKRYHANKKVQCVDYPEVGLENNDSEISFESETSFSRNGTTENDSFLSTSSHTQSNENVPFPQLPLSITKSTSKKNKSVQCKPMFKTSCVQAVSMTKSKYVQVSENKHFRSYGVQKTTVTEKKLHRKKYSWGKQLKNRLFVDLLRNFMTMNRQTNL